MLAAVSIGSDSIAINRLKIRGDKRASQALVREIQHTGWSLPLPGHLQHAWVLVRQIEVTGKAADLRQITGRELQSQLLAARDFRAGGAERANAVWFESFPVLLAFLLADIATGQAVKWYWECWSYLLKYTRQEAIARVFFEHAEYLPAVIASLNTRGQLQRVWSQISSDNARVIARELARMHSLPLLDSAGLNSAGANNGAKGQRAVDQTSAQYFSDLQALKPAAYWQALLAGTPRTDGRVLLACTLQGLTHAPLWLKRSPETLLATFTAWVYEKSANKTQGEANQGTIALSQKAEVTELLQTANTKMGEAVGQTKAAETLKALVAPVSTAQAQQSPPDIPSRNLVKANVLSADLREVAAATHYSKKKNSDKSEDTFRQQTEVLPIGSDGDSASEDSAFQEYGANFFTAAGGFFYLLNPLNRLLTPELLAAQTQASGWQWLWDLHRLLALRFPHLQSLFEWPLKRFLLQQIAPDATEHELQQLALQWEVTAPSDFATRLFERLSDHFKKDSFWVELAETTGFLSSPAQLVATASHIDIYLSLNHVRLDLRLAAWDTNPGWLPWLGRVVTFHYLEQPMSERLLSQKPQGA